MNCHKCGTKTRVIESREKNGDTRRREYCPTCRFESAVLVPEGCTEDQRVTCHLDTKVNIRDKAQGFVNRWTEHFNTCHGLELDKMAQFFREENRSYTDDYVTRRFGFMQSDEEYRGILFSVLNSIARRRINEYEEHAAALTVASPRTAEECQAREAKRPQGRPGDWWLGSPLSKPAMVSIGQRWLRYDKEPVVITDVVSREFAEYNPVNALSANHHMNRVRYDVVLAQDDGQWKFFGYEPEKEPKGPKVVNKFEYKKPDAVRVGQKYKYRTSGSEPLVLHAEVIEVYGHDSKAKIHYADKSVDHIPVKELLNPNSSSPWVFAGEPESKLIEVKVGQRWSFKNDDHYMVREINPKTKKVYFAGHDDSHWEHLSTMVETGSAWKLVSEPCVDKPEPIKDLVKNFEKKPASLEPGQKWRFMDGRVMTIRSVNRDSERVDFECGTWDMISRLYNDQWEFVGGPEEPKRPKPAEICNGQVWQYLDRPKCVVHKIVKQETQDESSVYFFGSPNPPYSTVKVMLNDKNWKFIQFAKDVG